MTRLLLRRLGFAIPLLFAVLTVTFVVTHILPGDPTSSIVGQVADEELIASVRHRLGFDRSLWHQYVDYLRDAFHFDFGTSLRTGNAVTEDLRRRLPATLELVVLSLAFALAAGVSAGTLAAFRRGRPADAWVRAYTFVALSIPSFWLALVLLYAFFFKLGIAPAPTGQLSFTDPAPPARHGRSPPRQHPDGQHRGAPGVVRAHGPARRLVGTHHLGAARAARPVIDGRGARVRLRRIRARLRAAPVHPVALRGSRRAAAGGHVRGDRLQPSDRRRRPRREDLLVAGRRAVRRTGDHREQLHRDSGVRPSGGGHLRHRLPRRRRAPHGHRPARDARQPGPEHAHPKATASFAAVAHVAGRQAPRGARHAGRVALAPAGGCGRRGKGAAARRLAAHARHASRTRRMALAHYVAPARRPAARVHLPARPVPRRRPRDRRPAPGRLGRRPRALRVRRAGCERPRHAPGASWRHPFGTDEFGFDIFTRTFYAARIDLPLAAAGVGIGAVAGFLLGLVAGASRGWLGDIVMRAADVVQAFPQFILALALIALTGNNLRNVVWVIGFLNVPIFLRLMRSQVLSIRELRFVEVGIALGNSHRRLALRHILPNAAGPVIVQFGVQLGFAIEVIAGLAFLGVGISVPTPEWGSMIQIGASDIITGQWWTATFPGLGLVLAVAGFNLISEGLERTREL